MKNILSGSMLIVAIFLLSENHANAERESMLAESGSMEESQSQDWWLNSGGIMRIANGEFSTNLGNLPTDSYWQKLYAKDNPADTDDGQHPQNIFRLVTRQKFQDFSQSVYFNIDAINLSDSENRNASNGVLLFNRYQDSDNLYYVGLRVDGHAVIKKKIAGKYHTLAEKDILSGEKRYHRKANPNFLPTHKWIGIRTEVVNSGNGVNIKLFVDLNQTGNWKLVLEVKDGEAPLLKEGYAGIRTDFMDVQFRSYTAKEVR